MAYCSECGAELIMKEHSTEGMVPYCPACGSFDKTVLSGKDFTVRQIVVPEERG